MYMCVSFFSLLTECADSPPCVCHPFHFPLFRESTHSLWHWQMACDAPHKHAHIYTNAYSGLCHAFAFSFIYLLGFHEKSHRKLLKYQTTTYVLSSLFIVDIVYSWFFFICTKYSSLEAFLVLLA